MKLYYLLLESVNFTVDLLSSLELLLHGDQEVDTIDNHLDELNFRETKSVSVGDIVNLKDNKYKINPDTSIKLNQKNTYTAFSSAVDAASTSLLKSKFGQDLFKSRVLGKVDKFAVNTSSDASSLQNN